MKYYSQNVSFEYITDSSAAAYSDKVLLEEIAIALRKEGYTTGELREWPVNDYKLGWGFATTKYNEAIKVDLASYSLGWKTNRSGRMLFISSEYIPGLFARLLKGKRPSASGTMLYKTALIVNQYLVGTERFCGFRWAWDGEPPLNGPAEPPEASSRGN